MVKVLSVAALVILAQFAAGEPDRDEISKKCLAKFPIPKDSQEYFLREMLIKNKKDASELCFASCILEEVFGKENEGLKKEGVMEVLLKYPESTESEDVEARKKNLKPIIESCLNEGGSTTCEKNYNAWKCMEKKLDQGSEESKS
ncbi:uncharacterized protein LOC124166767 [Ischnura elegans]|uniref:uncharacterized protein LOC124166767 n=1 Tax=Ischnura elegans TaxID=197161 RepID=UPI001ED87B31|nr:uncharacterized protein LOC124166767 [Ischnura elegans]